jgi:uncharacterized protein (TIGR02145 family)
MKRIFILLTIFFTTTLVLAQNKTMTIYYNGGTANVVNLANTDSIVIFICVASKVNYGGKAYNTVLIGSQCWLKENLDLGIMINGDQNQTNNTPTNILEKYCYDNEPNNCTTYGGLYQWNEAMQYVITQGAKGICPTGWHIPTLVEFQTLAVAVNNDGNSLKAIGQGTEGGAGTNTSGFSALLAGYRNYDSHFYYLGSYTNFVSSTEVDGNYAFTLDLRGSDSGIRLYEDHKIFGFSVRCLKD